MKDRLIMKKPELKDIHNLELNVLATKSLNKVSESEKLDIIKDCINQMIVYRVSKYYHKSNIFLFPRILSLKQVLLDSSST